MRGNPDFINKVVELHQQGLFNRQIAELTDRSIHSVKSVLSRKKLRANKPIPLSPKEEKRLVKLLKTTSFKQTAKQTGVSLYQIKAIAKKYKIKKSNVYTEKELKVIEQYAEVLPPEAIADLLPNRSLDGVIGKIERLKLSSKPQLDNWNAKQLSIHLGVNYHHIQKWLYLGLLRHKKRGKNDQIHCISRQNFKEFYETYKDVFPALKTIDPDRLRWILDDYDLNVRVKGKNGYKGRLGHIIGESGDQVIVRWDDSDRLSYLDKINIEEIKE